MRRATLRRLLASADPETLRRRSNGTRWTNEQLLFHMVFGYMIVRALLILVRIFGRLPAPVSRGFAAVLNFLDRTVPRRELLGVKVCRADVQPSADGGPVRSGCRFPATASAPREPREPCAVDELPHPVGPVLHAHHDPGRGLPLPDATLRFPPPAAERATGDVPSEMLTAPTPEAGRCLPAGVPCASRGESRRQCAQPLHRGTLTHGRGRTMVHRCPERRSRRSGLAAHSPATVPAPGWVNADAASAGHGPASAWPAAVSTRSCAEPRTAPAARSHARLRSACPVVVIVPELSTMSPEPLPRSERSIWLR